jgi:hypothetical protein
VCRNIRVPDNFQPPTTDGVREAALPFVRKVSGSTHPFRANTERSRAARHEKRMEREVRIRTRLGLNG